MTINTKLIHAPAKRLAAFMLVSFFVSTAFFIAALNIESTIVPHEGLSTLGMREALAGVGVIFFAAPWVELSRAKLTFADLLSALSRSE